MCLCKFLNVDLLGYYDLFCILSVHLNFFAVIFTPQKADVLNVTSRTASVRSYPTMKATNAAPAGYNVSVVGVSKFTENLRIFNKIEQFREGNQFVIQNLLPNFNFTCKIQQMFLQGVGNAFEVKFETDEDGKFFTNFQKILCREASYEKVWAFLECYH